MHEQSICTTTNEVLNYSTSFFWESCAFHSLQKQTNKTKRSSQLFFLDHSRIWKITLSSPFRRQYLQDVLYKHVQMLQLFFVLFLFLRAQMGKYSWSWLSAPYTDDVEKSQTSQRGQETQNTTPNITSLTGRPNQTQVCDKVYFSSMEWDGLLTVFN